MRRLTVFLLVLTFFGATAFELSAKRKKTKVSIKKTTKSQKKKDKSMRIITSDKTGFIIEGKRYDLNRAIIHLLEKNEQVQQVLYDAAMADSDYMKFQKKYSPFLQAEGSLQNTEWPDDITAFNGDSQRTGALSASVAKSFSTGTTIAAGVQHSYSNSTGKNPQFGDIKYHQPVVFVSLKQELLKNFMGYQERRQNEILKNADTIVKEVTVYQMSNIVVGAILDSWRMSLKGSELDNTKLKLRETRRVRRIIRSNVSLGLNERFDLNYWNALVAASEAQVTGVNYEFEELVRQARLSFNIPENIDLNEHAVLTNVLLDINSDTALKVAYSNRSDYKNALLNVKNAKMQLEIYRNEALPSLTGELSASSMGERDELADAWSDSLALKDKSYGATVTMTYPLDDTEQQANVRDSLMKYKQAQLELSRVKKIVRDDVKNSISAIKATYTSYKKISRARKESERYYIRLRSYLKRGRFSASVVKDALDAMVDSRQRELGALIEYNGALLMFDIAQNNFFQNNDINIYQYIENKKKSNK